MSTTSTKCRIVFPSNGGLKNPDFRYRPGCDIAKTLYCRADQQKTATVVRFVKGL